jgi:uncharacterized repeat protein (TIGR03943 family)
MNRRRLLRGIALAVWALFFWWLAIGDEMTRYLGPRTYWVAWFGAIVLSGAAIAHMVTLRTGGRERVTRGDVGGVVLILVPIFVVAAVPSAGLGALAAARKTSGGGIGAINVPQPPARSGEIGFSEIYYGSQSSEYAQAVGIVDGTTVDLTGFVTHPKNGPSGTFSLTRFYISCCAADAVPYSVIVHWSDDPPDDLWLRIGGTLAATEDGFAVTAERVTEVSEPKNPYLY